MPSALALSMCLAAAAQESIPDGTAPLGPELTVTLEALGPSMDPRQTLPPPGPTPPPEGVRLDEILNTALKLWEVIKENQPVVNISRHYANAMPEGISHWGELSRWSAPEGRLYSFKAVNKFGVEVVTVRYQLVYTYGGRYEREGREAGRYLASVTVEPLFVDVKWGYTLDMDVKVPSVVNVGSSEDPVAGMTVNLEWRIKTPLQKSYGTGIYFVDGGGRFVEVGGPFRREYRELGARLEGMRAAFKN